MPRFVSIVRLNYGESCSQVDGGSDNNEGQGGSCFEASNSLIG